MKAVRGYSLLELVIVLVIMSIMCGVLSTVMADMVQNAQLGEDVNELDWQVRESLERMTRELRQINPKNITTLTATQLAFSTASGNAIQYQYTSPTLYYNGIQWVTNVASLAFSYFDGTGTATAVAANVRYILVAIMFQITDSAGVTSTPIYYTTVAVRNGI